MAQSRQILLTLVLAAGGLIAGLGVHRLISEPGAASRFAKDSRALAAATWLPEPRPLPAFMLQDGTSNAFTRDSLRGAWTLMFFGFANCPDVCPTTMTVLAEVANMLRNATSDTPRVVFISVDPNRDSPADAARYAGHFDPDFRAATGNEDALRELTVPLGILHRSVASGADSYTVDHSAAILLINPAAELNAIFSPPHKADAIAADLQRIIRQN